MESLNTFYLLGSLGCGTVHYCLFYKKKSTAASWSPFSRKSTKITQTEEPVLLLNFPIPRGLNIHSVSVPSNADAEEGKRG